MKGSEASAPECTNGQNSGSWEPRLNDSSGTQYFMDIVHSADGTGSRVRTEPLRCRCLSGNYRMKDYMSIVQYSDGSSQDRSSFIEPQAALCIVPPPSGSPPDPSSSEGSDSSPDSTSPSSPEDMTFPDLPDYMACNDVVTGVTGAMVCKKSDGSSHNMYCADTQKYADDPSSIETVCYSGREIEKAANTACQDGKTAYLVGGRWQCASIPPPIDRMSYPEQGCPAGTIQTSVCSDWQCLPPSYRLPPDLDCKAPIPTSGSGSGSTGSGSNTGSGTGSSGTGTGFNTSGLQQDSTGKQANQLLSSISGKQNAIADNTAKSAASDAQTASNTNKIANDTSKMVGSLSGIDSKMGDLDSKLGNIDSKLGGTGRNYPNSTMPSSGDGKLYKTAYPDGLSGVWNKRKAEIMETPIMKSLIPNMDFLPKGGKCPSWTFKGMKVGDVTYFEDMKIPSDDLCWFWDVLKALVIIQAIIYARKIIMGI